MFYTYSLLTWENTNLCIKSLATEIRGPRQAGPQQQGRKQRTQKLDEIATRVNTFHTFTDWVWSLQNRLETSTGSKAL